MIELIVKLWVCGQILFYIFGTLSTLFYFFVFLPHMLSDGYWPKWYKKLKDRKEKRDEDSNPITLKLN